MKNQDKITPPFSKKIALLKSGEVLELCENTVKDKTHQVFSARLESIPEDARIIVGHAYGEKRGGWLEIGAQTVSAYNHISWKSPPNTPLFENKPHGLDIKDYITVIIDKDYSRSEYAIIQTSGGECILDVTSLAGYDGSPLVMPEGLELSDVSLSFTSDGYRSPIWIFGDSYLSHNEPCRWPYYLYRDGYTDVLLSGFPGEGAPRSLVEFKTALTRGTPEFALWLLGMNNGDPWQGDAKESEPYDPTAEATVKLKKLRASIPNCTEDSDEELLSKINPDWLETTKEFLSICSERGIEPILATIPQTPKINNLPKNEWIRRSGYRFIDFNRAVGADLNPAWFPDMLMLDDVHPTALGAKALYARVLTDFPEIMRR